MVCWKNLYGNGIGGGGENVAINTPSNIAEIYDSIKENCSTEEKIAERVRILGALNSDWIMGSMVGVESQEFCYHGIGPIYALAEAFLTAISDEERRKGFSAEVEQRTKKLSPKIAEFLEGLKMDLPEGSKNIGEE